LNDLIPSIESELADSHDQPVGRQLVRSHQNLTDAAARRLRQRGA
jgi:hypothetical protein